MTNEELTPRQQEIVDLLLDGWEITGHDLKYNFDWHAYSREYGINARKWPRRNTIKALVTKGYITIEPDPKNPGHFIAKLCEKIRRTP